MSTYIKLAGVTFDNTKEDGGESRQTILKNIFETQGSIVNVSLEACNWEGEYAIKVKDKKSRDVIGFIPRNMLRSKMIGRQMTAMIMEYKGIWSARLTPVEAPTKSQYHFMLMFCKRTGREMPAYDKRAYGAVFKEMREA